MANEHSQIVPSMQPTSTVADFKFWCQKVLPLVYDDSLSYYEVLNKMVVYLNDVIDNINATTANVEELEDDFLLLQAYVNNFFDDIDQLVTYTERAEAAETSAISYAASAAESASNSATSASNSASSASSSATSALSAMDAKDAAVAAKTAAETALTNAQTAATNAANSATAASGSATNAAASATAASGSATNAATSATAAQTAATSAESDAESAADSAAEAVAAVDTIVNGLGTIAKTIENVPIASVDDALASFAKKLVVNIEPVQSGSGDPAPDNVRPITGWTGAKIQQSGSINLFDKTANPNKYIDVSGEVIASTGSYVSDKIYINRGVTSAKILIDGVTSLVIAQYDKDNNLLDRYGIPGTSNASQTEIYPNTDYILFSVYNYDGNITACLNNRTFAITEFNGLSNIPITFPDAAGTVYGGTLENNGTDTWTLTVDRVAKRLLTARNLSASYPGSIIYNISSAETSDADFRKPFICNRLKYVGTSATSADYKYGACINSNATSFNLWVSETAFADLASASAWLAENETQICYYLATPIEYTITEEQALMLLNGINNVWADTGNIITLEYFTNAENYVTSQINLAKALIAPVLKEMKADTALVANDFRIVGNTLYRITGNIASGGTLTPNTNCVATTVGAILKSLLSA